MIDNMASDQQYMIRITKEVIQLVEVDKIIDKNKILGEKFLNKLPYQHLILYKNVFNFVSNLYDKEIKNLILTRR